MRYYARRTDLRVLLAAIGTSWAMVVIALSYPGYASFDTAYQWWMARSGEVSSLWPPTYIYLLKGLDVASLGNAPTVLYLLNVLMFAIGAGILAAQARPMWGAVTLLALLFSPVIWVLVPQIWSDVVIGVLLLFASALLSISSALRASSRVLLLGVSLLLIALAVGVRHNAVAAALPLLCWWSGVLLGKAVWSPRALVLGGALSASLFAGATYINQSLAKVNADTWAITALWDLQAISVSQNKVLWPRDFAPAATMKSITSTFDPVNAVATYSLGNDIVINSTLGLTKEQRRTLFSAWWQAIIAYPADYAKHRSRVMSAMLGDKSDPALGTSFGAAQTVFKDNPERKNGPYSTIWYRYGEWLRLRGLINGGHWIGLSCALATACLAVTKVRRRSLSRYAVSATCSLFASAVLYFASLWVAAPTSDLRYAFWIFVAVWAGSVSAIASSSEER